MITWREGEKEKERRRVRDENERQELKGGGKQLL